MIYSDENTVTERIFNDKQIKPGTFEKRFILNFLSNIPLSDLEKIVDLEVLHPTSEKEWRESYLIDTKKGLELKDLYECQLIKFKIKLEI